MVRHDLPQAAVSLPSRYQIDYRRLCRAANTGSVWDLIAHLRSRFHEHSRLADGPARYNFASSRQPLLPLTASSLESEQRALLLGRLQFCQCREVESWLAKLSP